MKSIQKDLRLLPYAFKKIIYGIFGLILVFAVLSITKVLTTDKEMVNLVLKSVLLVVFLLLALTEEKEEDELILKIRLKAFAASFVYGVAAIAIDPLINLIFESRFYTDKSANELLISMFIFYFIIFHFMKRKR